MERHDKRCGELVCLPVVDADCGVDAAQDMCLDSLHAKLSLHLREYHHAGLIFVLVLCCEDLLNLVVQVVLLAEVGHTLDNLVVVDTLDGLTVDVVFLVGATQCVETHCFDVVHREIELRRSSHYHLICHNDFVLKGY